MQSAFLTAFKFSPTPAAVICGDELLITEYNIAFGNEFCPIEQNERITLLDMSGYFKNDMLGQIAFMLKRRIDIKGQPIVSVRGDGSVKKYSVTAYYSEEIGGYAVYFEDITAYEELSEELREYREDCLEKVITDIISDRVNMLLRCSREPLTLMLNGGHGIKRQLKNDTLNTDKLSFYNDCSLEGFYKINRIVNNLSTIADERQGILKLFGEKADIVNICGEVVRRSNEYLGKTERSVRIGFECDCGSIPYICDTEKIQRVLYNLIQNAIKFTADDGKIVLSVKKDEEYIKIAVSDNGKGMTEEELSSAFSKFSTVKDGLYNIRKGLGLGLYIARMFTEMHGGSINLKSECDKGTVAQVVLPLKMTASVSISQVIENSGDPEMVAFTELYL